MTGVETALIGAAANAISSEVIQWLRNSGDDISESEWIETGAIVGRELKAMHIQYWEEAAVGKGDRVKQEAGNAGKIFRELSMVGEDYSFDEEVVKYYSELASTCTRWETSPSVSSRKHYLESSKTFLKQFEDYKRAVQ